MPGHKKQFFSNLPAEFVAMYFVLSKTLDFLLMPSVWIAVCLLTGLLLKNRRWSRVLLWSAFGLGLVFSNPWLFYRAESAWALPAVHDSSLARYDVGIVPNGMGGYSPAYGKMTYNRNINRLVQAHELYRKGIIDKILLAGGPIHPSQPEVVESLKLKEQLTRMGVPQEDILVEKHSRNTAENAAMSFRLLAINGKVYDRCLLITSARHMRRALATYHKAGIPCDAYPTEAFPTGREPMFKDYMTPRIGLFEDWRALLHEVFGYWSYQLAGYI
jgi:uncharacterized SAM-binding protein YcdF (DUF218 family)